MQKVLRDTFLEVNLDNIEYNIKKIKEMIGKDVAIAAVLKANAYGQGAVDIAPTVIESGADIIAVAALTEALELRRIYKDYNILIMGYTSNSNLEYVVENNIIQTIFSYEQAEILNKLGSKYNKKPKVHIKYDTGFNRLGFKDCSKSIDEIIKISKLKNIEIEGMFSHFALKDQQTNKEQYDKFLKVLNKLENEGINIKYKHICDSIAGVDYPQYRLDMIRPGAIIYGLKSYKNNNFKLKQSMTFKTRISYIKKIQIGEGVSYDYLWEAKRDSVVATLPFGYADGYPRNMRDKGKVTINGKQAPIIGVICMDQCMVDITDIPEAKVGDEVIIYSDGNNNTMSVQQISELAETNKNEIVSRITRRTPRVYIKDGKVVKIRDYLLNN